MSQSKLDPCLFIGDTVIVVMYVDNILMWSTEDKGMINLTKMLNKEDVDLEEYNDTAGFLRVRLTKTSGGSLVMTQEDITNCIIIVVSLL